MNIKFNKALYILDKGDYDKGLELLKTAFEEESRLPWKLEIKSCMMEVLYEMERFDEVRECIDFILQNTDEYDDYPSREIAEEIQREMNEMGR